MSREHSQTPFPTASATAPSGGSSEIRQLCGSHVNCMHFTGAYVCAREGDVG